MSAQLRFHPSPLIFPCSFLCLSQGDTHFFIQTGKLADLVMWKPSFFGAKPEMVIKGGSIAWANMGDPNASIPTPEPIMMRPMFGAMGRAASTSSIAFVSKVSTQ